MVICTVNQVTANIRNSQIVFSVFVLISGEGWLLSEISWFFFGFLAPQDCSASFSRFAPGAPNAFNITVTSMFHRFFSSLARFELLPSWHIIIPACLNKKPEAWYVVISKISIWHLHCIMAQSMWLKLATDFRALSRKETMLKNNYFSLNYG